MIIAIDGPAASGKSTVAQEVAARLGYHYLGTGAMYRAVTVWALEKKIDIFNEKGLTSFIQELEIDFSLPHSQTSSQPRVLINGIDVTAKLNTPEVDRTVSYVARVSEVRKILVKKQRQLGKRDNIVAEGRDIGTVVFPEANIKIFLTATPEERARRRQNELQKRGHLRSLNSLHREIISRDRIDSTRSASPLTKASDAYSIDTTNKSAEKVVKEVLELVKLKEEERT